MHPLSWLLFIIISAFTSIHTHAHPVSQHLDEAEDYDSPLHYRIADLDPRLNISKQKMIEISQEAAAIWEQGTGKRYFVYDPKATFTVNLVFDQRQVRSMKRTENLKNLEQEKQFWLDENQKLLKLKQDSQQLHTQLELQKIKYQAQLNAYASAQKKYLNKSNTKNLNLLQEHTKLLNQQRDVLKILINDHDRNHQQIQVKTDELKQLHEQLTQSVDRFNQNFAPQLVHKGQFKGKQIFIYEFSSIDDLRLTLAHEFGHALGLKHTHNPKSLMYPRIKEQDPKNFQLTATDLALLNHTN
ncbi:MAG: matrixin [Acinetobacter sp. GWC1_38_13]|uniref:matrixin family metalloprotease n=1 Tax=Acinetobacter junii TaxID=40215 RepID=UPI0008B9006A|nr:matrixin family metalloprotease [Acinetobacter sp. CUI P1]OFW45672.1 MAG: matrixin [Acinetobacter sp. GWC1_38_13]VTX65456.1 Matrixin [Acinetobacter junii]